MDSYDIIVVGGSAAGITAAMTAKKHYPGKTLLSIRKDDPVSIPCGIPYTMGVVGSPRKNLIPVVAMCKKNEIDQVVGEVTDVNGEAHTITLADGSQYVYDKLILATGSRPIVPPLPGADKKNIFAVRKEISYLENLIEALDKANDLCIVGCGFIGVEIAEECRRRRADLNITIVEMQTHCLQLVYDEEFCIKAEEVLKAQGINLLLDEKVDRFEGEATVEKVILKSGQEVKADMVIMGIGASANTDLAQKAGLDIGATKAIEVNRYMQTSDKDIFACGDCTEKVSFFDGKSVGLKLASIATMEARMAGANLYNLRRVNMGVIGVFSTMLGGEAFAAAGLTQEQAAARGYSVVIGEAEGLNRHPGDMPGAANMKVKLLFEAGNGFLLGGQISGATSGGELINAVSACINQSMTAENIATFQTGTHPALTASPVSYQLVTAAENAIAEMNARRHEHR